MSLEQRRKSPAVWTVSRAAQVASIKALPPGDTTALMWLQTSGWSAPSTLSWVRHWLVSLQLKLQPPHSEASEMNSVPPRKKRFGRRSEDTKWTLNNRQIAVVNFLIYIHSLLWLRREKEIRPDLDDLIQTPNPWGLSWQLVNNEWHLHCES